MAVFAIVEPLVAAKIVPLVAAKSPNLPGKRPSHRSRISMVLFAILEWNINSPININIGTGARVKVDTEENMLRVTFFNPAGPIKKIIPRPSRARVRMLATSKQLKMLVQKRLDETKVRMFMLGGMMGVEESKMFDCSRWLTLGTTNFRRDTAFPSANDILAMLEYLGIKCYFTEDDKMVVFVNPIPEYIKEHRIVWLKKKYHRSL